ncbi:ABC transporter substrate-binding protein [Gordonia sp. VNK1]|uniref:ABC transporter substrate-binding protein n=1 Tax=Gordonia oleivorans TaxID=3156618 RepID=UPI0032B388A0
MSRRQSSLLASLVAVLALLAACADTDTTPADRSGAAHPDAIVSLSPTATEMLFAVGAGDQVKAVDDQSNYPSDAPKTRLSGYTPNLEAILGYDPDLVVLSDDSDGIIAKLKRAGVEVLQLPAAKTLDDTYTQIEQVGAATGHVGDAAELVSSMRTEIDKTVQSVPTRETPLTYYYELDNTFYSVTDNTYIGQIMTMLGLKSIATGGNGYPQLSAEYILDADPQVIFLADAQCCGVTPQAVAARAGWGQIAAVKDDQMHVLDGDIASRWGPRIVDLVNQVAGIVKDIPVTAPAP